MIARRIAIETWDPDYGAPVAAGVLDPSDVSVNAGVELGPVAWKPMTPAHGHQLLREDVLFIDGVRRTDASAWIAEGEGPPYQSTSGVDWRRSGPRRTPRAHRRRTRGGTATDRTAADRERLDPRRQLHGCRLPPERTPTICREHSNNAWQPWRPGLPNGTATQRR